MIDDLLARAAKMKAQNAFLVTMRSSGHHPDDREPLRNQLCAPQCRHLPLGQEPGAHPRPPISEHLIAFYDRRDIVFVGEDIDRAIKAIQEYAAPLLTRVTADPSEIRNLTGTQLKICYDVLPRLVIEDGILRIWRQDWNDVLYVFDVQVIGTTGAPLIPDGTTP